MAFKRRKRRIDLRIFNTDGQYRRWLVKMVEVLDILEIAMDGGDIRIYRMW
jgi:hypothetical protein